jgi:hypothetical protein
MTSAKRGGGTGGRSLRTDAMESVVKTIRSVVDGIDKVSRGAQKRINAEHDTGQQLIGCDSSPIHPLRSGACFFVFTHSLVVGQQLGFFVEATALGFPTAGQRKTPRQTINTPAVTALRIAN